MLVCAACPVSVSARPARRSARNLLGARDTTPVLCRSFAACHRGTRYWHRWRRSCWSRSIELSCFTRRSAGRDGIAVVHEARGERAMIGIALRDQKEMVQRGPSLRFITCASPCKSLSAEALFAASLPARAGVVTRRLAQAIRCCNLRLAQGPGDKTVGNRPARTLAQPAPSSKAGRGPRALPR